MTRAPATRSPRRGFTLIELMVVVLIIGILAALISAAVARAVTAAKRAAIQTELANLSGAIEAYKAKYGSYPPNQNWSIVENTRERDLLVQHVRSIFPRVLQEDINTIPLNMSGAEILWFCLRGYTNDPRRPVDFFNATAKRDNFFQFEEGRGRKARAWPFNSSKMTQPSNPLPVDRHATYVYVPPRADQEAPYVYFDCSRPAFVVSGAPSVYWPLNGINTNSADRIFGVKEAGTVKYEYNGPAGQGKAKPYVVDTNFTPANNGKFQIISAGLDGNYGEWESQTPALNPLTDAKVYPDGINYSTEDGDNLVNFSDRSLEDSRP